jgi:hypothetical protein
VCCEPQGLACAAGASRTPPGLGRGEAGEVGRGRLQGNAFSRFLTVTHFLIACKNVDTGAIRSDVLEPIALGFES